MKVAESNRVVPGNVVLAEMSVHVMRCWWSQVTVYSGVVPSDAVDVVTVESNGDAVLGNSTVRDFVQPDQTVL